MNEPDLSASSSESPAITANEAFEVHRQMVVALFITTVALCAVLFGAFLMNLAPAMMAIIGAGAMGGFLSALRRLYAFQRVFPQNFFKHSKRVNFYLVVYSMIPALVGSIAAVVLYVIFASGLVKGSMFPAIRSLEGCGEVGALARRIAEPIRVMLADHDNAGAALEKMRTLTNGFAPGADACNTHRAMLDALSELEVDTHQHVHKENNILFTRAIAKAQSLA